jgi:hypothetical protein
VLTFILLKVLKHLYIYYLLLIKYMVFQWSITPRKKVSHFHVDNDLFVSSEKKDVLISTI